MIISCGITPNFIRKKRYYPMLCDMNTRYAYLCRIHSVPVSIMSLRLLHPPHPIHRVPHPPRCIASPHPPRPTRLIWGCRGGESRVAKGVMQWNMDTCQRLTLTSCSLQDEASFGPFRASSHCRNETSPTGSSYCHGGPNCSTVYLIAPLK